MGEGDIGPKVRMCLPAAHESLPLIRKVIATLIGAQALTPRRQEQVLLAVGAAAADAVRHMARDGRSPREVVIEGRVGEGRLVITVIEDGPGIALLAGTDDVLGALALIGAFADRVDLGAGSDGGASTQMSFSLSGT
jgi:hypothetical protein